MLKAGDRGPPMGELDIITGVFVVVDEWIKPLALDPSQDRSTRAPECK